MKKNVTLLLVLFLAFSMHLNAQRTLYINGFFEILEDPSEQNELLEFCQDKGITGLLLYDLHKVHNKYDLTNSNTNTILADFISKAKNDYGIISVGGTGENPNSFINVIDPYNNSRSNADEKIDIYNLEFEFWNENAINNTNGNGNNYCAAYLEPNNLSCDIVGAFDFFISTLKVMRTLASNNPHPITTEAYLGWLKESYETDAIATERAIAITNNLDRLRLHAYVGTPDQAPGSGSAFGYSSGRLRMFAEGRSDLDLSIIFSAEQEFMQEWLLNNSLQAAENIYTTDWNNESENWTTNFNLKGFTYYNYGHTKLATLSVVKPVKDDVIIYPTLVKESLFIKNFEDLKTIKVFNSTGQLILITEDKEIDFSHLSSGIFFLQLHTDKKIVSKKIIKI